MILLGQALSIGYVVVFVFQVYLFYHYLGEAMYGYWWTRTFCPHANVSWSLAESPSLALAQSVGGLSAHVLTGSDGNVSRGNTSDVFDGMDNVPFQKRGRNDCTGQTYTYVFLKLAVCSQFAGGCCIALATYMAYLVVFRNQSQILHHLSTVALLTNVIGLASVVSWASGMVNKMFEDHWTFWPFVISYLYVLVAVLFLMGLYRNNQEPQRTRPGPHRMTEAEWRRWQRVQERTRTVDSLLEQAGGGDVIYSQHEDGSWQLTRWLPNQQDWRTVHVPAWPGEDPERVTSNGCGNTGQAMRPNGVSTTTTPATRTGQANSDVLLVIPSNRPNAGDNHHTSPRTVESITTTTRTTAAARTDQQSSNIVLVDPANGSPKDTEAIPRAAPSTPCDVTPASSLGDDDTTEADRSGNLGQPEEDEDQGEDESCPLLSEDVRSSAKRSGYGGT